MKDTFDIKQYLVENKLTEATRENRKHFGKVTLNEHVVLEAEGEGPESILSSGDTIIAKGEGFDVAEIKAALEEGMSRMKNPLKYTKLHINNTPSDNGVREIEFNEAGSYEAGYFKDTWQKQIKTVDEVANNLEQELKDGCRPKELESHIQGWILAIWSNNTIDAYPLLDQEGVQIYKDAEQKLSKDISDFYAGSNYWGD